MATTTFEQYKAKSPVAKTSITNKVIDTASLALHSVATSIEGNYAMHKLAHQDMVEASERRVFENLVRLGYIK